MFNYECLERSNFLMWIKLSTREEIVDALRNNREKMRYLLDKYGDEIERGEAPASLIPKESAGGREE